jgi:NAD(P)-dependent dehydrogenase (short-subunit alcohol dehydrogenase family)
MTTMPPFPPQNMNPPGLEAGMDPAPRFQADSYRPSGKLSGKVAAITGGDSGIGRAVALIYAREGADIAITYLEEESPDARDISDAVGREGRRVLAVPGDVRDPEFCRAFVQQVIDEFGQLDILHNNAAFQKQQDSLDDLSIEQFERTFRTNIFGYFYLTRCAVPVMKRGSAVINTGSVTGVEGSKALIDYAATKGAIHAFTKSLAQNLIDSGIRVNCVAPGPVWTPLNPAERSDQDIRHFGQDTPIGRPAQPEEIAPSYVFLASNADSSYITGHVLLLLGGETTAG